MRRASGQHFGPVLGGSPLHSDSGQSIAGGIRVYDVIAPTDRGGNRGSTADPAQTLSRMAGDVRLAAVFKQIRTIVGVSESEMARRLGADISIILDFEAGAVDALPPWPVTARLIERYAAMADVDPSPILSRIMSLQSPMQVGAPVRQRHPYDPGNTVRPALTRSHSLAVEPAARPNANGLIGSHSQPASAGHRPSTAREEPSVADRPVGFEARSKLRTGSTGSSRTQPSAEAQTTTPTSDADRIARRRRRFRRSLAALGIPIALIAAVFALLQTAPRPLYAFAGMMPGPLATPVRGIVDIIVTQTAPIKDGLRWIDTGDPRLRKNDRLLGK
jgi:transcriptional regulator with XRE-family HTH domain